MFPGGHPGLGLRIGVRPASPLDEEGGPIFKGTLAADEHLQKIDIGGDIHQSFVYFVMDAAKVIKIRKIVVDTPKTEGAYEGAQNEVTIYQRLKKIDDWKKYVLPFKASEKGSRTIVLDFDYVAGKDLLEYIRVVRPSRAKLEALLAKAKKALAFCHAHNILHGDIKPDNFYVSEDGDYCYIFDFGNGYMEDDIEPEMFEHEIRKMESMIRALLPYAKGGARRSTRRRRGVRRLERRRTRK